MAETPPSQSISSKVLYTRQINWKDLSFLQTEQFKELSPEHHNKLKRSIKTNFLTQPFYVWKNGDTTYCLDGYHRIKILLELEAEGTDIPAKLPATYIACPNIKQAAELVLQYSSQYARITAAGFNDFISFHGIDAGEISLITEIPHLEVSEEKIIEGNFEDQGVLSKNQYGVIVICESEQDQKKTYDSLSTSGYNCKIVVT